MKKTIIYIFFLITLNCKGQDKNSIIRFDKLGVDTSKVEIYKDTLFLDVNSDNKEDVLLKFTYKYSVSIPKGESGQILAVYFNSGNNEYRYKTINKSLLWLIHNEIKSVDNKTFIVINEGGGQDWNRYYCYITYDDKLDNWYLSKTEVYRGYYKDREDTESKKLIFKNEYTHNNRILFEKVSFDELFGKLRAEVPNPVYYGKIKAAKAYIFKEPGKITNMYLIKDNEVKIVKEKNDYLKIYYYGKITIEGWIKKSDVE